MQSIELVARDRTLIFAHLGRPNTQTSVNAYYYCVVSISFRPQWTKETWISMETMSGTSSPPFEHIELKKNILLGHLSVTMRTQMSDELRYSSFELWARTTPTWWLIRKVVIFLLNALHLKNLIIGHDDSTKRNGCSPHLIHSCNRFEWTVQAVFPRRIALFWREQVPFVRFNMLINIYVDLQLKEEHKEIEIKSAPNEIPLNYQIKFHSHWNVMSKLSFSASDIQRNVSIKIS